MVSGRIVKKECPKCGRISVIGVPYDAYNKWQKGMTLQEAWPEASSTTREICITGLCKWCQEEVFDSKQ